MVNPKNYTHPVESNKCHDYCCSAFARFEDEKLTKEADLQNPIHPILRRENFPAENFNYAIFEPCLRLASHLLDTDAVALFVNTLFYGEYRNHEGKPTPLSQLHHVTEDSFARYDEHAAIFPKPGKDTPNEQIRERATRILEQMADMVEFGFTTDPYTEETYAMVSRYIEGPLPREVSQSFPHGSKTSIDFTRTLYNRLAFLTAMYEQNPHTWRKGLLLARFEVAHTIVHELAHAMTGAAYAYRTIEMFYMDSPIAEAGFELEAQLFGGLIVWPMGTSISVPSNWDSACDKAKASAATQNIQDELILIKEWPSSSILAYYKFYSGIIGWRRPFRAPDVVWRIPITYLESLFTSEFWKDRHIREPGVSSLHAPRVASWLFNAYPNYLEAINFETVKKHFGPTRAQRLCPSSDVFIYPEELLEDEAEIFATTGRWFDLFGVTRTQRRREQRKAAKALKIVVGADWV